MEDGWTHNPFELHSVDGWLYGRGTTDNKGALGCWLAGALDALAAPCECQILAGN